MEGKLQTSFIPKKPLVAPNVRSRNTVGFFSLIAYAIFFITLLALGGVYFWQHSLTNQIIALDNQLKTRQQAIKPSVIDDLMRLDNRIESAKKILSSHLALSQIFPLIADNTLQSVQLSDFNYSIQGSKLNLTVTGVAPNFSSVALQSDAFAAEKFLKDQSVSGLNLDKSGTVSFKFSASVDPTALSYSKTVTPVPAGSTSATNMQNAGTTAMPQ